MAATPSASDSKKLTSEWRLSSGGCLRGDVTVTGKATFWIIEADGNKVVVRELFEGMGNGFSVKVTDTRKPVDRSAVGYYDVDTQGEWVGPNGRHFNSRGVDRVYVKDGSTPTRAVLQKFRTECPG
jgi:hypothetical protein